MIANLISWGALWLPLSFLSAFSHATSDAIIKKWFQPYNPFQMAVLTATAPIPFIVWIFFFLPIPNLTWEFYEILIITLPLEILAYYLYMKALKISPISLSIPFLSFTPVFMILTGWLILGERINFYGIIGILMVVLGAYILNIQDFSKGILAPFKAIFKERGCLYILITAFIYSITAALGKKAILLTNPLFFGCFYLLILGIIIPISFWFISKGSFKDRTRYVIPDFSGIIGVWILNGFINTIMMISHSLAITMTNAAYMIAIKRTNVIFSIFYGKILFHEENIIPRLIGSILMILGISIIAILG